MRKKDYSILSYLADPGQIQQLWQGEKSHKRLRVRNLTEKRNQSPEHRQQPYHLRSLWRESVWRDWFTSDSPKYQPNPCSCGRIRWASVKEKNYLLLLSLFNIAWYLQAMERPKLSKEDKQSKYPLAKLLFSRTLLCFFCFFYCCVTNHPKTYWLKKNNHLFVMLQAKLGLPRHFWFSCWWLLVITFSWQGGGGLS